MAAAMGASRRRAHHTLSSIYKQQLARSLSSITVRRSSGFRRSDFDGQPFTGSYEIGQPTRGPLGETSNHGAPRLNPRKLKAYLDKFLIGQEIPKKLMSNAIYHHYQRIQEILRQEEEEKERVAKLARSINRFREDRFETHPVESEYPGQIPTVNHNDLGYSKYEPPKILSEFPLEDHTYNPTIIEKSNVMMIGPTGVGKTLMAKTLARVLNVPFVICDCTPLTQAGYIGEDVDVAIHRLLAAAQYDVAATEHGIVYFDELDKISAAKVSHGKDVSGEGVQQALLRLVEGTTVTVTAKSEKSSRAPPGYSAGGATSSAGGGLPKSETYTVRTDNILFIFGGAFVGLDKIILNRVNRSSIGFGAHISPKNAAGQSHISNPHSLDPALFRTLPFQPRSSAGTTTQESERAIDYNPLALVTPSDYQTYGIIPELTGRIPITTALSSLTLPELVRILTEPHSSLVSQRIALFATWGCELAFTSGALHAIAGQAYEMGTGARGLRSIMERVMAEPGFETPGSSVRFCLVTEDVVKGDQICPVWGRGMGHQFRERIRVEAEAWERKKSEENAGVESFEEFREQATSGL